MFHTNLFEQSQQRPFPLTSNGRIQKIDGQQEGAGSELVAVIVTIRNGSTYDSIFTSVKQKTEPGTHVNTYLVQEMNPADLLEMLQLPCDQQDRERIVTSRWGHDANHLICDVSAVEPSSVVFNWECCSGCTDSCRHKADAFGRGKSPMPLMAYLLSRSFMVMCSDYSLKALIHDWDELALGANPFVKVGEFDSSLTLRFDPITLARCNDSAQLQMVGELCNTGEAHVDALSRTIAFALKKNVSPQSHQRDCANKWHELEVLTVATKLDGQSVSGFATNRRSKLFKIGEHKGLVGHCILRYPSGGRLLVSSPHWIELSKLDVTSERLIEVAEATWGQAYAAAMRRGLMECTDEEEQYRYVQEQSHTFVSQTAPHRYCRSSFSKASGKNG